MKRVWWKKHWKSQEPGGNKEWKEIRNQNFTILSNWCKLSWLWLTKTNRRIYADWKKLMSLISFILLVLCMLAPMKKNRALKGNKIVQVILKPHAVYGILIFMTSLVHGVFAGKKAGIMSRKLAWCCLLLLLVLAGYQKRRNTRGQYFIKQRFMRWKQSNNTNTR